MRQMPSPHTATKRSEALREYFLSSRITRCKRSHNGVSSEFQNTLFMRWPNKARSGVYFGLVNLFIGLETVVRAGAAIFIASSEKAMDEVSACCRSVRPENV